MRIYKIDRTRASCIEQPQASEEEGGGVAYRFPSLSYYLTSNKQQRIVDKMILRRSQERYGEDDKSNNKVLGSTYRLALQLAILVLQCITAL